jgi:cobalt/nickel transport system ATP-binding protein
VGGGHVAPVIDADGISYEYPDGTVGVRDVDCTVEQGERVAVIGSNGAGKSTLLLLLGGLHSPSKGATRFFGVEDPDKVRSRMGVLMQDPDDFLFNPTVREDIEFGPAQLDVPRERADEIVERLADRLDLDHLLDKPPFRLSGGEKKRAALASILSFEPELLLLDEPTSNLDPHYEQVVLDLLDELNRDGVTTVVSTPDVDLVPRVADRVCLLGKDGCLQRDDRTREVLTDRACLERNGIDAPSVVKLFSRVGYEPVPVELDEAAAILDEQLRERAPRND